MRKSASKPTRKNRHRRARVGEQKIVSEEIY